jgi:hypothetical protein
MPINKLEQLRKHIFDIERIQFEELSKKLLDLIKLFRSEVYHGGIRRLEDSLVERKIKKGMLLPF